MLKTHEVDASRPAVSTGAGTYAYLSGLVAVAATSGVTFVRIAISEWLDSLEQIALGCTITRRERDS